MDRVKPANNNC